MTSLGFTGTSRAQGQPQSHGNERFHGLIIAAFSLFVAACGDPPETIPSPPASPSNQPQEAPGEVFTPERLTSCDPLAVMRISFNGPHGELELRRTSPGGILTPIGHEIEGFDEHAANQIISTACGLMARRRKATASDQGSAGARISTTVELETTANQTTIITIGDDEEARRLTEIQVSGVPGVFFVSRHIARALRVGPQRFARSPEQVKLDAQLVHRAAAHAELHRHHEPQEPLPQVSSPWGQHRQGQPVAAPVLRELQRRAKQLDSRQDKP